MCVCVCVCVRVCVRVCVIISFYGLGFFSLHWYSVWVLWILFFTLSWMFQHDYFDTCGFEYPIYIHVFCIFVFAPVQRKWACSTWKGALEIRSLLLLLQLVYLVHSDVQLKLFMCVCPWYESLWALHLGGQVTRRYQLSFISAHKSDSPEKNTENETQSVHEWIPSQG